MRKPEAPAAAIKKIAESDSKEAQASNDNVLSVNGEPETQEEFTGCEGAADNPETHAEPEPDNPRSMKWHHFLMVFLIVQGIWMICGGISFITGISTGLNKLYQMLPGLKACDMIHGIALTAIGIYVFIVRNQLKHFHRNARNSLVWMYILTILANLTYLIWASAVTGAAIIDYSAIGLLGISVVCLIISMIYYPAAGLRRNGGMAPVC